MVYQIRLSVAIFSFFLAVACGGSSLFAIEETLSFTVVGGSNVGGNSVVNMQAMVQDRPNQVHSAKAEGVQVAPGFQGKPAIQMREAEYVPDSSTDLLLHFNESPQRELGSGYSVLYRGMNLNSQVKRMGASSGIFNQDPQGLVLKANPGSLFEPGNFWNDFSIEFWLYPTTMDEGEQILAWQGSTWLDGVQRPQSISVQLKDRRLVWDFTNFFVRLAPGREGKNVLETTHFTLKNKREILPRVWQHHLLRWDASRCELEYLIDGMPEDIAWTTVGGNEGGAPYRPWLGENSEARVSIGARLSGFLDEMRISRRRVEAAQTDSFDDRGSYVIFNPIDFRDIGVGSKLLRINARYTHPGTSDIGFYYKMTNSLGMALRDDPAWIRFTPGTDITDRNQGQFLYFKIELLPDGNGRQGPSLQELNVSYRPDPPPPPPGGIMATPADGTVILRWNPVPVNDIQGYLVYYGTRPGQYFGEHASIGKSPQDVGKPELKDGAIEIRISGLDNGRIYYFAVASYDVSNNPIYGIHLKRSLSKEVSARPAR